VDLRSILYKIVYDLSFIPVGSIDRRFDIPFNKMQDRKRMRERGGRLIIRKLM
jgi:hypothetical protein